MSARHAAFLRAINVGGHTVTMAELKRHFEALKLREVATFIASGNVFFTTGVKDLASLERKIEKHLERQLGFEVRTFVRSMDEVARIAALNPFGKVPEGGGLDVGFLPRTLTAEETRLALAFQDSNNDFRVDGREFYWLSRSRVSDSTFSYARLEKAIKLPATFRGMNTVTRMVQASSR